MKASRNPIKRPSMRRAVILFPSGFTLGNLFFGIFAIIAASRLEFTTAGVYVMLGGICDALDGRVARATNSGTQFGEELDSLVDAITFGLAPGMIMYFAVLNRDGWDWVFVFLFAACAVLRLARFNIEQAGSAKTYFQGLPSPAAGITLASYYWFSQSWLYSYGAVADLPWHVLLRFIMVALAILMISNVPYPTFPRTGFRSLRSLGASLVVLGSITLLLTRNLEYFFPLSLIYVSWGLLRWIFYGLFERRQPTIPYDLSEGEDDEEEEFDAEPSVVRPSRPPARDEAAARPDRTRSRGERPERTARPDRPEREPRAPKADGAARVERADSGGEDSVRPERPQRTEAERAARREKREKRDKREGREGRPARAERGDRANVTVVDGDAPAADAVAEPVEEGATDAQVIGVIPGGATDESSLAAGAPGRKRKRRRRRGARDRGEPGAAGAGDDGGDAGDEAGDEDGGRSDSREGDEGRSPYAAPAAARPFTPPLPAPAPPPAPATPVVPSSPPSSEPAE